MTTCPGCGARSPVPGPVARGGAGPGPVPVATHRYLRSSAQCFADFGELLAASYAGLAYAPGNLHQTRVDAWVCQHPGGDEPAANQALALCLMTLRLVLQDGVDPARGPALHRHLAGRGPYRWLPPPARRAGTTVRDVLDRPDDQRDVATLAWAREVWSAWSPHHDQVQRWLEETGTTAAAAQRFPRGAGRGER